MTYAVKEIFYTLQGEGANVGRPAVFCRFAGCNLWTGLEQDRSSAVCQFCDTDFVGTDGPGGGRFDTPAMLAAAVAAKWPVETGSETERQRDGESDRQRERGREGQTDGETDGPSSLGNFSISPSLHLAVSQSGPWPLVVCTGGEPLLQMDAPLIDAVHEHGFEIAVETNGTRRPPPGIDWICVSPKAGAELVLTSGEELKLIYPQPGAEPERFVGLDFQHFYLQPMDGPDLARNVQLTTQYCLDHPFWRLSLQTHKLIGIP